MEKREQCYGFILVPENDFNKFLILERRGSPGDWTFPKGHHEEGETPLQTAKRETKEESGVEDIKVLDFNLIHEEYKIKKGNEESLKYNDYFIGLVKDEKVKITIQIEEIQSYKWVSYKEAIDSFKYETRKNALREAKKYLENYASHLSH